MKHLFTLSEWLRGKLVKLVNLVMQFLKLTKRQSDTTIFAKSLKSLKSLMSIFAGNESYESTERYRVKSRISPTFPRLASVFTLLFAFAFMLGVGNAWGASVTLNSFGSNTSGTSYQNGPTNLTDNSSNTWVTAGYRVTNDGLIIGKGGANYLKTPNFANNIITSISVTWSGNTSYYLALQTADGSSELEAKSNPSSSDTKTCTVDGSYTQLRLVGRRSSGTNNAAATISSVVLTYLTKITLDKNGGTTNGVAYFDNNSTAAYATSPYGMSLAANSDSYTCTGYWSATSGGTKVLNADGTFANANVKVGNTDYIKSSKWVYAGGTVTLYAQWESAGSSCSSEVDVHKGAETNGTYSLSAESVCADGDGGTVNVTDIEGTGCYEFDEIVATNGTPDNTNMRVTGITAETTITVKFKKKTVNTYIDGVQDNGSQEDCSTTAPTLTDKTAATTGTCAQQHYHFVGWVSEANKANPTAQNIVAGGSTVTVNGTNYYAVWAKGSSGSSATVTFKTNNSDSSTDISSDFSGQVSSSSGMSSYSGSKIYSGSYGLKIGSGSAIGSVTCTLSSSITTKTITVDAKQYGTNSANIVVTVNGGTSFGSALAIPSSGDILTFSLAANADPITVSSVTVSTSAKQGYLKTITVGEAVSYSDYRTECCTELAPINGSVNVSQAANGANAGKLQVTWEEQTDKTGWAENGLIVKIYKEGTAEAVHTSTAQSKSATSYVSNVTPDYCSTYYAKLTPVKANNTYCEPEEGGTPVDFVKGGQYTYSVTLDGMQLKSGETEEADNCSDFEAIYEVTGTNQLDLTEVSVTNAGEEGTGWEWNSGTGTLFINSEAVTGNVEISITGNAPATPTITLSQTTDLNLGSVNMGGSVSSQTFTVNASNLSNNLSVTLSGEGKDYFSVSPTAINHSEGSVTDAEVTISVTDTDHPDDYIITVTVDDGDGGATAQTFDVLLSVLQTYTVNFYINDTETPVATQTDVAGADMTIPSDFSAFTDCSDFYFVGWKESSAITGGSTTSAPTLVANVGTTIPAANKNYYAVFAEGTPGSTKWEKATSMANGDYLIVSAVADVDSIAFDGSLETLDAVGNKQDITINANGELSLTNADNYVFTFASVTGGYSIKSKGHNLYIGQTSDANGLASSDETVYVNTVEFSGDSVNISSGGAYLRYNSASNQVRFRYFRSATYKSQKKICLYKKTTAAPNFSKWYTTCPHVSRVTLSAAEVSNGSISFAQDSKAVTSVRTDGGEDVEVDVVPDPATGYELTGVALSGVAGASYDAGVITIPANAEGALTATATFAQANYTVTMAQTGDADAELSEDQSNKHYNDVITVTAEDKAGYVFKGWSASPAVTFANAKALSTTFSMPNGNVTVTAAYTKIYTPAEALALDDLTDSVYVEGVISQVDEVSTQYKNATYWISADGTTTNQIKIYRGKHINKADVTVDNAAQIAVGNKVRVRGKLSQSSNVNQFGQGASYIFDLTEKVLSSVTIGGTASKTVYSSQDNVFSHSGLTATAAYSNTGYSADVTATATWSTNLTNDIVTESGDVEVTASFGGMNDTKEVAVTYSAKTLDHITLSYESTYTFKGFALPTPSVYAYYVEAIPADDVTAQVAAANGFNTLDTYNKDVVDTYTITVSYTLGDVTETATYDVEVRAIYNTKETAHSVADAITIINAVAPTGTTADSENMYVRGVVSTAGTPVASGNNAGKLTYYINDSETTDGQLQVYQGLYFASANFTSDNNLAAGDEVIVEGHMLNYNSNTPELKASPLVYLLKKALPTISVSDVAELEVGQADLDVAESITKQGNGVVTLVSGDNEKLTIDGTVLHAVAAGDVEVTVNLAATNNDGSVNYKANSTTFNVHVVAEKPRYAVTFDADGGTGTDPVIANQLEGATVNLPANPYSKANSAFAGWVVNDGAITITDGHFTMPAANVTIKATWNDVETCAISFQVSGSEVATVDAPQTAAYSLAEVYHPTIEGFTWIGWSETKYDDEVTTLPTIITSYTPALNQESKTLYGIYSQVVGGANQHYVLDYADEELGSNTSWGSYGSAYNYTAADGGAWVIKAYKNSGMQINTGKDASIKIPNCSGEIISISITCGAAKAVGLSASDYSGSGTITYIAEGTDATSQTLDLSGESVKGGYIVPKSGSTAITHIDVEYSGNVTYYTSSPVTRYKVTYLKGEATNVKDLCAAERKPAGEITLCAAPTCADKNFVKWSDGTNLYAAEADYTLEAEVTFTATWTPKPKYTVTYTANGGIGTAPAVEEYMEGETVEVKENEYFSKPGFDFDGWLIVYNNGVSDQEITPEEGEFTMVAYNVTIKAKWAEESKQKWALVTDVADLKAGDKYVIAASGYNVAMAGQNENNRAETAVVKRNEGAQLKGTSSMQVITLAGTTGAWEFNTGAGYLYAASSSKNWLRTQAENDANGRWTISITDGVATITATGTNTNNQLKYNNSSKIFSCYSSGQQTVALYKEIPMTVINTEGMDQNDVPDGGDMTINEDQTWTVTSDKEVGDLYMKDGAIIANSDGSSSAKVEANDLYFKARHGKSNQIFDLSKITVEGNMYYDFQLCDGDLDANYWYSISVPFDVDLKDGVFQVGGTTPLVNHSDFEVWGYNTALRAQTQSNGWERVKDNMMHAGKAYLIGFNPGQPNIIRLKAVASWKANLFSGTSMSVVSTGGSGDHDNWNGLANPTGRYIDVDTKTSVFNNNTHGWDSYDPAALQFNFVVGTAFFVQSADAIAISNENHHNEYRAPKRVDDTECAYAVRITRDEATSFDNQIIVRASEEATGEYTQGHDMLTMNGTSSNTAAMLWTVNYGGKRLAIEEAAWLNGTASYELKMFAPKAGTYHISVAEAKANADLYLTYEGAIIWNLSEGAYPIDLKKGTTNGYGLLLNAKMPQTPTGVDNVQSDKVQCTKVILDEKVFILRGGQMYDVTGKAVK